MYSLIILAGFLLAMRGARPAPLQKPGQGLLRIWREAADLLLTVDLALMLLAALLLFKETRPFAQEYGLLSAGLIVYLTARYQRKTDVFLLSAIVIIFWIYTKQYDPIHGLAMAGTVSVGIGLFQTCFLGLRYRLLFSRLPVSMKGWPVLSLLAGSISIALWGLGRLIF